MIVPLRFFSATVVLIALSTAAKAGSTITDRAYWPNSARSMEAALAERQRFDAFDAIPATRADRPDADMPIASRNYRYHGGPKSPY